MSVKSSLVTRAKDIEGTESRPDGSLEPLARNKAVVKSQESASQRKARFEKDALPFLVALLALRCSGRDLRVKTLPKEGRL